MLGRDELTHIGDSLFIKLHGGFMDVYISIILYLYPLYFLSYT